MASCVNFLRGRRGLSNIPRVQVEGMVVSLAAVVQRARVVVAPSCMLSHIADKLWEDEKTARCFFRDGLLFYLTANVLRLSYYPSPFVILYVLSSTVMTSPSRFTQSRRVPASTLTTRPFSEFDESERNWGARPGFMKATMGMDDKNMDQYFPKIWSGKRRKGSSDNYIGDFNLNNTNEESELMDFNKLHLAEGDPLGAEQRAAENAAMSGEKQKLPVRVSKQKAGMASKTGQTTKSDVVYANEQHFKDLRDKVQLFKAHESAKYDWRETLNEGKPSKENPEDEGMHPYVSIMPHKDSKEKEVKKKYDDQKKVQDALAKAAGMVGEGETSPSATRNHTNLNENPMDFESALDKLISEDWKSDLKASNEYFKKRKERSPEEVAAQKKKDDDQKAKNFAGNRNNNVGQMDHSKKND